MEFKFVIDKTDAGWHVTQVGSNGETLNSSEVLTSHENAMKNIKAVYSGMKANRAIRIVDNSVGVAGHILDGKFSALTRLRKKESDK